MRLPEEDNVLLVGIDLLVHAHVLGRVGEADGTGAAEIAAEKGEELVEQLFTELWKVPQGLGDVLHERRLNHLLEIGGLDAHQVDEAGLAVHPDADEDVSKGIEEAALFRSGLGGGLGSAHALGSFDVL